MGDDNAKTFGVVVSEGRFAADRRDYQAIDIEPVAEVVLTPDGQRIAGTPDTGMFTWPQGAAGEATSVLDAAIESTTGSLAFLHGNTGSIHISKFNLP